MNTNHRKYYMHKLLYQIPKIQAAKKEPFNALSQDEWLGVVQHIFAHTVEGEHLIDDGKNFRPYRP
jgi:hypothetical protein